MNTYRRLRENVFRILSVGLVFIVGCQTEVSENVSDVVTTNQDDQIEQPAEVVEASVEWQDNLMDACAEIGQTRLFQGTDRVNILKEIAGLSSQEAALANENMEKIWTSMNQLGNSTSSLEGTLGMGSREWLAGYITEECVLEMEFLQMHACELGVLQAKEVEGAWSEVMARMLRINAKKCGGPDPFKSIVDDY